MVKNHQDELIGHHVDTDYNNQQFSGKIVGETKETITIIHNNVEKTLLKHSLKITSIDGKECNIRGQDIRVRAKERIKLR